MPGLKVKVETQETASAYEVRIEPGSLGASGQLVRKAVGKLPEKAVIVSNKKIFALYGLETMKSLRNAGLQTSVLLVGDGERYKNLKTVGDLLAGFSEAALSRTDVVVSLGGGVIGDVAGFAAATHLRGVPFLQIPTTLLSMIDSSVGGKTGINTSKGKNLAGAFYHPNIVILDPTVLSTLPRRELTAGLCEAIKQAVIANRGLFCQTVEIIDRIFGQDAVFDYPQFTQFLADQVKFKATIVAGDPRESSLITSSRSRKILNFGHTFAHALENATNYRFFRHGEAVGHGIIFAAELSKKLGFLDESVVNLLRGVVHRAGELPSVAAVDPKGIFEALKHDKKRIGGSLNWILLKNIGKPIIIPHELIGDKVVKATIAEFTS